MVYKNYMLIENIVYIPHLVRSHPLIALRNTFHYWVHDTQTIMFVQTRITIALLLMESYIDSQALEIHKNMIELIDTCFTDRLKILTTTPDIIDIFDQITSDSTPIPMIIIDDDFKSNNTQNLLTFLGTFVLNADSKKSFQAILLAAKSSPWWNVNALFIVVGNPQERCTSALEILFETWKMELQSVLFMCQHHDASVMLYTYNPYANRAPYPWKEVGYLKKEDNPWTLFAQRYVRGPEKCGSLDFYRTKFIDVCKIQNRHQCRTWEEVGKDQGQQHKKFY